MCRYSGEGLKTPLRFYPAVVNWSVRKLRCWFLEDTPLLAVETTSVYTPTSNGKRFSSPAALPPLAGIYWEKNIRYSKCRPDVKSGRRAKISICRMPFSSYGGCVEEVAMSHGNLNRLRKPHPLSYAFLLRICRTGVFSLSSQ